MIHIEKNMIDILIVEDEIIYAQTLEMMLEELNIETRVLKISQSVENAIVSINKLKPKLVFLDVMLPDGNGFDILNKVGYKDFRVVFTTSYAEYAVRAFDMSALHYLLKPISSENLNDAMRRYLTYEKSSNINVQLDIAQEALFSAPTRIMLRIDNVNRMFLLNDIIRVEAETSYTKFIISNHPDVLISRSIKFYEKLLPSTIFSRIHKSHIINVNRINKIDKGKTTYIEMSDGQELQLSETYRDSFFDCLNKTVIT